MIFLRQELFFLLYIELFHVIFYLVHSRTESHCAETRTKHKMYILCHLCKTRSHHSHTAGTKFVLDSCRRTQADTCSREECGN